MVNQRMWGTAPRSDRAALTPGHSSNFRQPCTRYGGRRNGHAPLATGDLPTRDKSLLLDLTTLFDRAIWMLQRLAGLVEQSRLAEP